MAEKSTETRVKSKSNKSNKQKKNCLPLEKLLQLLECPVCWKRSEPSALIQCRNGHFGCKACFSKLKTCPICRIVLEPQILTFHQENIDLIQKELRHVENHGAQFCIDGIVKIFKCTDCKFTPTKGPVFQCLTGHVICYRCAKSITWCTPCAQTSDNKAGYASFTIRNLAVQEFLHFALKPCRFTKHGCSAIIKGFSQHEVNCPYSENECVIHYCSMKVSLPKLLSHIVDTCRYRKFVREADDPSKGDGIFYGRITLFEHPMEKMRNALLNCYALLKLGDDKSFLFCFEPFPCHTIRFFTYFLGVPEEAKKFHYLLNMRFEKDAPLIKRKAPVFSASMNKFDAVLHPDVISYSWSEFRELLNMNKPDLHFMLKVQVLENESELCTVQE